MRTINEQNRGDLRERGQHVPNPAPFRDALLGAAALVHDLTVVTRDLKDFQRFDQVDMLNPWT